MLSGRKRDNVRLFESLDLFTLALLDADPQSLLVEISSLFGQDVAMKMIDIFGGSVVRVPTTAQVKDAIRRACVWRDYSAGVNIEEIVDTYNIHPKTVYAIADRYKVLSSVAAENKEDVMGTAIEEASA